MKRKFIKYPQSVKASCGKRRVTASTKIELDEDLKDFIRSQLFECYDNGYDPKEIVPCAVDHVVWYIAELDEGERFPTWVSLAEEEDPNFVKAVKKYAKTAYDSNEFLR